ncbi:glycosyltransferase [Lactobacillus delbrueckii]|uniref:glycosyltransferase n=1 Tax=Lactobacillus delbrueckii TaxID=1584 RepID=UPI001E4A194C|nr:glycosyltransferase [Lactobacillus delbrueckii subsp. lactis]
MVRICKRVIRRLRAIRHKWKIKLEIKKLKKEMPEFGINLNKRQVPVIVSLTSYNRRFDTLDICIKSLLRQEVKPDKLILYLTEEDYQRLPENIKELREYGLDIVKVKDDLRPHKKYYYAMKEYPNAIVITTDDDVIYDRRLVGELLKTHNKFPEAIVTGRARYIASDPQKFLPYDLWNLTETSNNPSMELLATGVGGVLYPPHLLNLNLLLDKESIKKYIQVDDLWLKTVEILDKIPTVVCDAEIDRNRIEIPSAQTSGLAQTNVLENQNDRYWAELDRKYKLFDKLKHLE